MPRLRPGPVLIFFLVLLPTVAWTQWSRRSRALPVSLVVRVVGEDERPAGARCFVQVTTGFGVPVASGYTDPEGRLTVGSVPGGSYRVHVSGEGIQDQEEQFYLTPDGGYQVQTVHVRREEGRGGRPAPGTPPTVSVAELKVPKKARKELDQGNQEAKREHWAQAEAHFRAAIREYPQYAMAYNNLGIMRFQAGDPAGARAAFEKAVEINDRYAQAYVNLGRLLYSAGDNAGAENLMTKLLSFDPRNLDALIVLAAAQLRLGEFTQSAENALRVHTPEEANCLLPCVQEPATLPNHPSVAHFIAGRALESSHKIGEAEEQFRLYLAETPDGPLAAQVRAELKSLQKIEPPPAP